MPRHRRPRPTDDSGSSVAERFSDEIVVVHVEIDRAGASYRAGIAARRAGKARDARRSIACRIGWYEGARTA